MPLINPDLPEDGESADAADISQPFLDLLAVFNGHIGADNLEPGTLITSSIGNNAVTTPKIADGAVTRAKLEKPHYNKLMWSTTGIASGQVVGLQTTANFDAYDTTNGYGITATTGTAAYLTIARDGIYRIEARAVVQDLSGGIPKAVILWHRFSYDNGGFYHILRHEAVNMSGQGESTSRVVTTFLPADTRVGLEWYAFPASFRFGAPDSGGSLTDYQARATLGSCLSITEVR